MKSLTAAVKFIPRNATTDCGKTVVEVRDFLKARGVIFTVTADDFCVRPKGTAKDDGYFTDDLNDALATGLSLVAA